MANDICVFLETEREELLKVSLETLTTGRKMADENQGTLSGVLAEGPVHLRDIAGQYGLEKIYVPSGTGLTQQDLEAVLGWLERILSNNPPQVLLLGNTPLTRELAPRLAARLGFSFLSECVDLKLEKGVLTGRRPVLNGKAQALVSGIPDKTQTATLNPGFVEAKKAIRARVPEVVTVEADSGGQLKTEYVEYIKGDPAAIDLAEAEVILAVGKGLQDAKNLGMIEELARLLGASLGGTRVAVDLRYIPPERQIGMTGKTVSPRLFISCGISGQYPHTVSMDTSETIIVINKDKEAPMFKLASLGIVGSIEEVVPALITRIKTVLTPRKEAGR